MLVAGDRGPAVFAGGPAAAVVARCSPQAARMTTPPARAEEIAAGEHATYPAEPEVRVTDRVTFTCNGRVVDVDVEPGESLLSVLRERLGLVSVKDGCAPQGQCGCCTVLVDGDARVACVTAGGARRGPVGHDRRRARPGRARRVAPPRSSRPADRSAGSARPASSCAPSPRRRPALDRGAGRAPVPLHRLAHGVRSDRRRTVERCRRAIWPRPRGARELEGGVAPARRRRRAARRWRVRRRHRAARRARRGTAARRVRRRRRRSGRACGGSSARRCSKRAHRGRARCRAGARRSTSRRRCRCCRCRTAACGSRRRGSSPRTSSPTRRGANPAANPRRRSRTAARSAARSTRARPTPRASWPTRFGRTVRVVYSREDVVRLGPEAAADRGDRGVARRAGRDRRRRCASVPDARVAECRTASRSTPSWQRGRRRRGRRSARSCARTASPSRRCSSKARSTPPASTGRR